MAQEIQNPVFFLYFLSLKCYFANIQMHLLISLRTNKLSKQFSLSGFIRKWFPVC